MKKTIEGQVNFNTILLLIIGSLVTLGVKKADAAFESITRLEAKQEDIARRVGNVENVLGIFTPHK